MVDPGRDFLSKSDGPLAISLLQKGGKPMFPMFCCLDVIIEFGITPFLELQLLNCLQKHQGLRLKKRKLILEAPCDHMVSLQDSFLDNILTKALVACSEHSTIKTLILQDFEEDPGGIAVEEGVAKRLFSQTKPGQPRKFFSSVKHNRITWQHHFCNAAYPCDVWHCNLRNSFPCYFFHIPIRNLLDSAVGQSFSQLLDDLHLLNKVSRLCIDDIVSPSHRSDFLWFWCYLALYFLAKQDSSLMSWRASCLWKEQYESTAVAAPKSPVPSARQ